MAILCNEQQLVDIQRFCCNPFNFSILGNDPTFNLTALVYRHLLLQDEKSGHSPLLLGPLLVYHQKLFRSYNYFLSSLVGLKPDISTVKAVGTDGGKNLVDAAVRNFPEAAHVRCFRHLQQNIEAHLREHQFSSAVVLHYIHDLFGWRDENTYQEGLVHSYKIDAFDVSLSNLKSKWDQL